MFHTGDLQSGIALAVRDSKSVICFVRGKHPKQNGLFAAEYSITDDSPTSQQWERDFLNDEEVITS